MEQIEERARRGIAALAPPPGTAAHYLLWVGWVVLRLAAVLILGATSSTFVYQGF